MWPSGGMTVAAGERARLIVGADQPFDFGP
jgi:hypothetical protein